MELFKENSDTLPRPKPQGTNNTKENSNQDKSNRNTEILFSTWA